MKGGVVANATCWECSSRGMVSCKTSLVKKVDF